MQKCFSNTINLMVTLYVSFNMYFVSVIRGRLKISLCNRQSLQISLVKINHLKIGLSTQLITATSVIS